MIIYYQDPDIPELLTPVVKIRNMERYELLSLYGHQKCLPDLGNRLNRPRPLPGRLAPKSE
jgi:hypothetical protein